jgi:predicted N-acetyltransferase YhbS
MSVAACPLIVPAQPADAAAIEALLDARFGPARHNRTAYRLRDGVAPIPGLSLVAWVGDVLAGSLQMWPLALTGVDGRVHPLLLLGPVAVPAACEGQGIASALMQAALARADAAGAPPVLLIGDAPFYGRFGFSAAATRGWHVPGPVDRDRLLLRGAADGLPTLGWLGPAAPARRIAAA